MQRVNESNNCFFEKVNNSKRHLVQLTKIKKGLKFRVRNDQENIRKIFQNVIRRCL